MPVACDSLEGVHATGLAPTQMPAWQVSVCVQALLSSQLLPSGRAGLLQAPVAGLHVPAAWHWSEGVHATGLAPTQTPAWQVSVCVQALPSSQPLPSGRAGLLHAPVAGVQVPAAWPWSGGLQTNGMAPPAAAGR